MYYNNDNKIENKKNYGRRSKVMNTIPENLSMYGNTGLTGAQLTMTTKRKV